MPENDLPRGAEDLTDALRQHVADAGVPSMPLRVFATPKGVAGQPAKRAEDTTFLGRLTDREENEATVSRSVVLTAHDDRLLHEIANETQRFGYASKADIIRHAVELLLEYYAETKAFGDNNGFATETLAMQYRIRRDAALTRMRAELTQDMKTFDQQMDVNRQVGDWEAVAHRLQEYSDMLDSCESETQARQLREFFAESMATRTAALALYRWASEPGRDLATPNWNPKWRDLASAWVDWYHERE